MGDAMTSPHDVPWQILTTTLGEVPFYIIEFDTTGSCASPAALDDLVAASKGKTDVFLFSHGWNNDWAAATDRYDKFARQFIDVRQGHWNPPNRDFRPALAGVFWPSTALVAPWERGPDIAGVNPDADDIAALADSLDPAARASFLGIASNPVAGAADVAELAAILAPTLSAGSDEVDTEAGAVTPDDLLEVWRLAASDGTAGEQAGAGGFIDDGEGDLIDVPDSAAWNPFDLIRKGIRLVTVLQMKDRAGRVGGSGVAQMLRRLVDGSDTRISMIGHSYGAKVVLSALCNGPEPRRKVASVLLLEPALSCYAFMDNIDGRRGGYRAALDRVRLPIITTYSGHDAPLTKFFHLAARRSSDLAEVQIAGQPPSRFAALGGYGPQGVGAEWITMPAEGEDYPMSTPHRIIAVDGTRYIADHGAVEVPETAWALLNQVWG
jgi:pimeloyl-ACP methyl ester carboxylesterase